MIDRKYDSIQRLQVAYNSGLVGLTEFAGQKVKAYAHCYSLLILVLILEK